MPAGRAYDPPMDFELPPDNDPRRVEIRKWIEANPKPSSRTLAEAGYVVPHWPKPWGFDADPIHQLIIDEELKAARIMRPVNPIGIGWAGPTILHGGTQEQKDKYLFPLLAGEELWCQLFSEPQAGSDLANLGTRAVRDGDEFVVNGSKIWTSIAQFSKYGILIARTDPDAAKHEGVSYFVCPMNTPGIEIRPIVEMTGTAMFNEVFFTDVRIPAENLIGEEHKGWGLAKVTLGNERVSLSGDGALWGRGPTAHDLVQLVKDRGGVQEPTLRQRLADLYIEAEVLRLIRLRTVSALVKGKPPGAEASIRKALSDEHGKNIMGLAKDLAGASGMLSDSGPLGDNNGEWANGFLFSPALTIGGGTSEVQRNIIGERVLGLPHDIDVEVGKTWAEARSTSTR